MIKLKHIIIIGLIFSTSITFGQDPSRRRLTEEEAASLLRTTLVDSTMHNVIGTESILVDEKKAIKFAEMILWDIYGKKNIRKQKPYNVFEIDGYWLMSGTMPKGMKGGIFMIIIDSRNYRVVRLTHWK